MAGGWESLARDALVPRRAGPPGSGERKQAGLSVGWNGRSDTGSGDRLVCWSEDEHDLP